MTQATKVRRALISVSDKEGLVERAKALAGFGVELISTGGTSRALKEAGLDVKDVADLTGYPEMMDGRVKTLHPAVHGGLLYLRDNDSHKADAERHGIEAIDLVHINLYPFEATVASGAGFEECIENIDIGGPAMLRAASKNFAHLTVLCNPLQYDSYLEELRNQGGEASVSFRQKCALQGFLHTCEYDKAISNYLMKQSIDETSNSEKFEISGTQLQTLRYGENPHQSATWYQTGAKASGWAAAQKLQGKELSYNNLVDLEAARRIIAEFPDSEPAAAVLKHTNPCGVAISSTLQQAYTQSFNADSMSAFGGIVALNKPIDKDTATELTKTFLECVVAPSCEPEAAEILSKKSKLRILTLGDLNSGQKSTIKAIAGGLLVQAADDKPVNTKDRKSVV